ncbi:CehA/McbA family metallohydrolase [Dyadobacter bucti]|uniref:CehA/McbA family metallohydrolase n=1 Tax=Dyadobacter bucti TaxID=2572203 RepID=UPI003F70206E
MKKKSRISGIRAGLPVLLLFCCGSLNAQVLDDKIHHLRAGDEREWDRFASNPEVQYSLKFSAVKNTREMTLMLRQEDVKLSWNVYLNGFELGKLDQDESRRTRYLPVPADSLKNGENTILIFYKKQAGKADNLPDDIYIGAITLFNSPINELLGEAKIEVSVTEKGIEKPVPARITITNTGNALQPVATLPGLQLAVRAGCIYTGNGAASFTLPAGKYKVYATRGFEYGVDSLELDIEKGQFVRHQFRIAREVPTWGWISSDTHVHTFTHSRHGDATVAERLLTIAGEGIELPVFTDHNVLADVKPLVREMQLDTFFTPVLGNEYTTPVGHFNVFPVTKNSALPDHRVNDWKSVARNLGNSTPIVILNHARDFHNNFQPFGPKRYLSVAGIDLDGWQLPVNAMEVFNSGSQQKDVMQLYRDWFGVLNHGSFITPVGSSDSHDVMRYLVGQGRTYIRDTAFSSARNIDINHAAEQFLAGRVSVSFGLLTEITVDKKYGPGEILPVSRKVNVLVRVLGPSWTGADKISLYANGQKIREARIDPKNSKIIKWEGTWEIPVKMQDTYLVAIAEGPDPGRPFWMIPNPYSRTSSAWNPRVIGSTGAVWLDCDKDGKRTSAFGYARQLTDIPDLKIPKLLKQLENFDQSVIIQVAAILNEQNKLSGTEFSGALKHASQKVQKGVREFLTSREVSVQARK